MTTINTITLGEMERLGVDESGKLYWDGKPVVTEEKILFQWWLNVSAIAGALSGVVIAVLELYKFFSGCQQ